MKPIFTLADGTQVLETTGDADALQYGGGVLYRAPGDIVMWDFWDAPEKNFYVYSADASVNVLDRYEVDVDELLLVGAGEISAKDLVKLSASKDPRARLQVLSLIRAAYGASHLDSEGPIETTKFNLASHWGFLFGVEKEDIEEISQEDYMIREYKDAWECGRVDGLCLGKYKQYEHALATVAENMETVGLVTNLFHEHAPGKIEIVQWNHEEHIGRGPLVRGKMPSAQWKIAMRQYATRRKPHRRRRLASSIRRNEEARVGQQNRIERARRIRDYLSR